MPQWPWRCPCRGSKTTGCEEQVVRAAPRTSSRAGFQGNGSPSDVRDITWADNAMHVDEQEVL